MRTLKTMDVCQLVGAVAALLAVSVGCNDASDKGQVEEATGRVSAACIGGTSNHDVTAVAFVIVDAASPCSATPIASSITPALETEPLPTGMLPAGGGPTHAFADGLFVLAPGNYRVCATPIAYESPSAECGPVNSIVTVAPGVTTEVVLVSQCAGDPNGGMDVVVGLNDPPAINALAVAPSKFITVCEKATITVTAADPNGDQITFSGTVLSGPAGTPGTLSFAGNVGTFAPGSPGTYEVKVTASDAVGGIASLQLPIHVSAATCTLVSLVGDKDNFLPGGSPADTAPLPASLLDPAFNAAIEASGSWEPTVSLDDPGINHRVLLSHIFSLPVGAVVQGATLQLSFKSGECTDTEFIFFDTVFTPPVSPTDPRKQPLILHDLVGGVPVSGQVYTFDIDLATTPVRDILTSANEPIICGSWDDLTDPAPQVPRNLLPQVQSGLLNLVLVDDTALDYSQLTVQYTIP